MDSDRCESLIPGCKIVGPHVHHSNAYGDGDVAITSPNCRCGGRTTIKGGDDEFGDHSWVECVECGEVQDA
jgi:hypothetical protein